MAVIVPLLVYWEFSGGLGNTFGNSCHARAGLRAKMYDDAAKERQKVRKGNQPGATPDNCTDLPKGDARDKVGQAFGVSGGTVDRARACLGTYTRYNSIRTPSHKAARKEKCHGRLDRAAMQNTAATEGQKLSG